MKITVICIGKTGKQFLAEGEKEYLSRLKRYCKAQRIEIPDIKNVKNLSPQQIKEKEGVAILQKIPAGNSIFLLDEKGKAYSSQKFANFLQQKFNQGGKGITFVIGGAYGFSEEVYQKASGKISLSEMTFSHQMVRMFFREQLYRAFTILRREPYHNS